MSRSEKGCESETNAVTTIASRGRTYGCIREVRWQLRERRIRRRLVVGHVQHRSVLSRVHPIKPTAASRLPRTLREGTARQGSHRCRRSHSEVGRPESRSVASGHRGQDLSRSLLICVVNQVVRLCCRTHPCVRHTKQANVIIGMTKTKTDMCSALAIAPTGPGVAFAPPPQKSGVDEK